MSQQNDPKNFQIRTIWVSEPETKWVGQYKVVFGAHFNMRAWQRFLEIADPIKAIMRQLKNNAVACAITKYPVYWDWEAQKIVGESAIEAVAVIQEGLPFVPVYSAGQSFVNVKTVVKNGPDLFFKKDTAVLVVDKNGSVNWARKPFEEE